MSLYKLKDYVREFGFFLKKSPFRKKFIYSSLSQFSVIHIAVKMFNRNKQPLENINISKSMSCIISHHVLHGCVKTQKKLV